MAENLLALVLVELLYKVNGVVGIEMVDLLGDFFRRHGIEQLEAIVLVQLHKHVGRLFLVKKLEQILGLLKLEIAVQLRYVGRVQARKLRACLLVLVVGYYAFQMLEIVLVKLFHNLEALARRELTARVISLNCSTDSCSGLSEAYGSASADAPGGNRLRRELRRVLRRCPKPVFTTVRNRASSQPRSRTPLRVSRTTPDFTLGGGLNTFSLTVKRYSTSYHA